MEDLPFVCPVQVRWRDLDAFAHVNNAALVSYLEIARAELWRLRIGGHDAADIPFVISHLEIDYRRPVSLYDEVEVGLRVATLQPVTFAFEYRIEANGELAAEARTVQVCIRRETGQPVRVPSELVPKLKELIVD